VSGDLLSELSAPLLVKHLHLDKLDGSAQRLDTATAADSLVVEEPFNHSLSFRGRASLAQPLQKVLLRNFVRLIEQVRRVDHLQAELVSQRLLLRVQLRPFVAQMPQKCSISAFKARRAVDRPIQVLPNEHVAPDRGERPMGHRTVELKRPQIRRCLPRDQSVVQVLCPARVNADCADDFVHNLVVQHLGLSAVDEILASAVLDDEDERPVLVLVQTVRVVVDNVYFVQHAVVHA